MDNTIQHDTADFIGKQVLNAWNVQITSFEKLLNQLTDEQLHNEVAVNRNSGIYLLGHLTAVHDAMHPLFGLGDKLYPQLENIYIKNPDKSGIERPTSKELRTFWADVNNSLSKHFATYTAKDWLQKHNAVSEEAFAKEPHRNKLAVVLNRTSHLAYHTGQLTFIKQR